jgi:superfamily I DNA/RNA helicase
MKKENIKHINCFQDKTPDNLVIKTWELKYLFGENKYLNLVLLGYRLLTVRKKFYEILKKHCENGQDISELILILKSKLPVETVEEYENIDEAIEKSYFEDIKELYIQAEGCTENEKLENMLKPEEIEDKNIKVMSIHKSKGLDADHVFMVGLVEGIIPNKTQGSDSIEAQRRRFYVGMTRAKKNLYLISNIKIEGKNARRVNLKDFVFDKYKRVWNGKASSYIAELKLPQ